MAENSSMLIIGMIALVLITAGLTYYVVKSAEAAVPPDGMNQTDKPTITARGEATRTITPDLLTIGFSVTGNGSTVSGSQADASAKTATIKAALVAKGVKESDIKTSSYYTQPVYNTTCDYGKPMPVEPDGGIGSSDDPAAPGPETPIPVDIGGGIGSTESAMAPDYYPYYPYPYCDYGEVIGYKPPHSLTVITEKINDGGSIIDAATEGDGAAFDYVYFSLKEETRISAESALQGEAAAAAKAKADNIAKGVGARLGKIVSINPDQYYYPYPYYADAGVAYPESAPSAPTEIFPSETTMSSSIIVVYELEQ